ncbi:MAG: hypothetical protein HZA66_06710 [Rhodopseudomonas palustris]|uniref:DUF3990 domain-containing protein n=1 Tax=Rhodopseudomonas palustris TaxID=1076 RepID=A0A933RVS8_RHOPL|nr:hypothetical protein [Rhodopseudomonas palustris]
MSRLTTSFVLGYHGCDEDVGMAALHGELTLTKSQQDYDWLGPGIYFWESDPARAREWAEARAKRGKCNKPFVIGAVIDLRNCLNLVERENLELLSAAHESFVRIQTMAGLDLPVNRDVAKGEPGDKLLRYLDCAVIRHLHGMIAEDPNIEPFDTVRGLFVEGQQPYSGSGFNLLTHTQIAVVNEDCIRGVFLPR